MDPDDYDLEPPSDAEVESSREDEEFWAAVDRARAEVAVEDISPELRDFAEAMFTMGALAFRREIYAARRRAGGARENLAGIQKRRDETLAAEVELLRAAVADYRTRRPDASDRAMATDLARKAGVPTGTLRDRLRRLKLDR